MNTIQGRALESVSLFILKSFRNGQWSVSGRVRDLTEKSCFVRAGVAVFLIGYKKDVLQGEVYPLSQEEEVNIFSMFRRWRIGRLPGDRVQQSI